MIEAIIVYALKIILIVIVARYMYQITKIYKTEKLTLKINFFSYLEVGIYIAIFVIVCFSKHQQDYSIFLICLEFLAVILYILLPHRIVLFGDKNIYCNFVKVPINKITKVVNKGLYYEISSKLGVHKVYLSLCEFNELFKKSLPLEYLKRVGA